MEESIDMTPRISVILPALLGYDSVHAALDSWEAQTCRDQLEILVLCPEASRVSLPRGQTIVETGALHLHEARAAGIRRASAEYVLLAEDHCIPDHDCVEALLRRVDEGWDVVSPALRPGELGLIAQGSFIISYSEWMLPEPRKASHVPGHNVVMRKQPLLDMGDQLERELISAMFLMRRLQKAGARFFVDDRARMRHFDVTELNRTMAIFFAVGQGCGATRLRERSKLTRALYGFMIPLIAARHFVRGTKEYARAGRRAGFSPMCVVAGGFFACVWAIGESVGAWRGVESVTPNLWIGEIKPVSREQAASA